MPSSSEASRVSLADSREAVHLLGRPYGSQFPISPINAKGKVRLVSQKLASTGNVA